MLRGHVHSIIQSGIAVRTLIVKPPSSWKKPIECSIAIQKRVTFFKAENVNRKNRSSEVSDIISVNETPYL